jgi:hypothetical protein
MAAAANVITIGDVLDLLERSVQQRGPDHRAGRVRGVGALRCVDTALFHADQHGIVAAVSNRAGLTSAALSYVLSGLPGTPTVAFSVPPNLTLGAVMALRAAAASELRGETWGTALTSAWSAATRIVELAEKAPGRNGKRAASERDYWPLHR